jgi:hypothetical protein
VLRLGLWREQACPVRHDGDPGHVLSARHYWWRSQMPKFWPSFCSPDGLATTLPDEVPSEVTIILLVVQGPRIVPCTPV